MIKILKKIKKFCTKKNTLYFKYVNSSAAISRKAKIYNRNNLVMQAYTNIDAGAVIMNTRAKFIMKKYSGAAIGLLVVTGNHMSLVGKHLKQVGDSDKNKEANPKLFDKDIIVEEDVWIGARVTLLYGAHIGRGAIIGAGSVIRSKIPPYSVVIGNPAKVVGFRFSPQEIINHEQQIYSDDERMEEKEINTIYDKFFFNRVAEIKNFVRIY